MTTACRPGSIKDRAVTYLWITNPTRSGRTVRISLAPSVGKFTSAEDLWGKQDVVLSRDQINVGVPARDAVVVALH